MVSTQERAKTLELIENVQIEVYDDSKISSNHGVDNDYKEREEELGLDDLIVKSKNDNMRKTEKAATGPAGGFDKEVQNTSNKDSRAKASTIIEPKKTNGDSTLKSYSLSKSKINEKELVDIRGPISSEMFFSIKTTPLLDDYDVKQMLGEGSFGQVKLMVHRKTKMERAVKIIKKHKVRPEEKEQMMMEVSILKTLDHPNIIKIFDMYEDQQFLYLVIE